MKTSALWNFNQCVLFSVVLVGYISHEEQNKYVILILGCIHSSPKFVAALPQLSVKFTFLNRHFYPSIYLFVVSNLYILPSCKNHHTFLLNAFNLLSFSFFWHVFPIQL